MFYVVGNLKMNMLSREEASQYIIVLKRELKERPFQHVKSILCPPFLYLSDFEALPPGIECGAQDVFWEKSGAYTGEISPVMLKNAGVTSVIIGHSERRSLMGETNEIVKMKVLAALKHLLIPIVCIGETEAERHSDETARVLELQVRNIFSDLSKMQAEKIVIAYEPRWAVGTDTLPTSQEILQVRVLLRKILTEIFDPEVAERIVILYGGSVKSSFLHEVSWEAGMDGVLVGRESLFPYEVVKMMTLLEEHALQENISPH
ncbi:MAG: triose-phosphate isomerase [Candidatus Moranbacteria bacterium]|nr:triose-phosphate isomerase [Candidatus Moranbacteria bacterium]